jgi:GTP-binding protein YchF
MADLETLGRNIERVAKRARSGEKESLFQKGVFEKAKGLLEDGVLLRTAQWRPDERAALRPLFLLTIKPMFYVANVGEDDFAGGGERALAVARRALAAGARWLAMCGDIECELSTMGPEDRRAFMADYGISDLALPRLLQCAYETLGLQTFFTAGEKEIKAWTIQRGDTAPVAAGKIHSDFEKGFVRAEVYSVDDLVAHSSEAAIRQHGKLRVEGREYVMQEGDVCHFLVNR